jgi:hypothetical protein
MAAEYHAIAEGQVGEVTAQVDVTSLLHVVAAGGRAAMGASTLRSANPVDRFGSASRVIGPVESLPPVVLEGYDPTADATEAIGATALADVEAVA